MLRMHVVSKVYRQVGYIGKLNTYQQVNSYQQVKNKMTVKKYLKQISFITKTLIGKAA